MLSLVRKLAGDRNLYKQIFYFEKMEKRKVQSKRRYIYAFLIGTFIFLSIFLLSYSFAYLQYQRISRAQQTVAYSIFENKLIYTFFRGDLCEHDSFERVSRDLGMQGRIIDDLENKFGKNDERVLLRKKFYTLVLLEHLDFVNQLNEKCGYNFNVILFFYSNELGSGAAESETTGRILDSVYSRNYENTSIYSFDVNLESELIRLLKEEYGVDSPNTLIVNDVKILNPRKIEDIETHLK